MPEEVFRAVNITIGRKVLLLGKSENQTCVFVAEPGRITQWAVDRFWAAVFVLDLILMPFAVASRELFLLISAPIWVVVAGEIASAVLAWKFAFTKVMSAEGRIVHGLDELFEDEERNS